MWMIGRSMKRTISPSLSILQQTQSIGNWWVQLRPCPVDLESIWDEESGRLSRSLSRNQCAMSSKLLCNAFETFSTTCLEHYTLDLGHFYTSPRLAWQAFLKKTKVRLELLTDPDKLLMFEWSTWGSITQAVHQYAQVNNKYMSNKFDHGKESHYLQYLDTNTLYGWMMSQNFLLACSNWWKIQISLRATSVSWIRKLGRATSWRLMCLTPTTWTTCTMISHSCVWRKSQGNPKAGSKSVWQEGVRNSHHSSWWSTQTWPGFATNSSSNQIRSKHIVSTRHCFQHPASNWD